MSDSVGSGGQGAAAQIKQQKDNMSRFAAEVEKQRDSIIAAGANTTDAVMILEQSFHIIKSDPALMVAQGKIEAIRRAVKLNLSPEKGLNQIYFIPRSQKGYKYKQICADIGYQGWIQLILRADPQISLQTEFIGANDKYEYRGGTELKLDHTINIQDRGAPIAYYCIATLRGGNKIVKLMSHKDMCAHRDKYSKTSYVWRDHFMAMAFKTLMVGIRKALPVNISNQLPEDISGGAVDVSDDDETMDQARAAQEEVQGNAPVQNNNAEEAQQDFYDEESPM